MILSLFIIDVISIALMASGMKYMFILITERQPTELEWILFLVVTVIIRVGEYFLIKIKRA